MQLEDEAFTAWMQRLTEARRNREIKSKDHTETFVNCMTTNMSPQESQVETDMENTRSNRNLNLWQKSTYNQSWTLTDACMKMWRKL